MRHFSLVNPFRHGSHCFKSSDNFQNCVVTGLSTPLPCLQLLRIDKVLMIGDVITHVTQDQLCKTFGDLGSRLIVTNLWWHKMHENNVVGVVTFHVIGLLPTNHIIILQWHTGVYEETFDLNDKIAQTMQNIWNVGKSTRVYWRNDYSGELKALGYCLWIVIVINLGKFTQWNSSHPLSCRCKV